MTDTDVTDDLGRVLTRDGDPRRVVSLVPSLTESLAPTGLLVGATDWCTHPADLDLARVRGTKNPDLGAIADLHPDLVIANQEENRRLDVERLTARGIAVWVTRIETVEQAFASLSRLFTVALGRPEPDWLPAARDAWAPPPAQRRRVAVPIWRDPWMAVGPRTFTGDLLARAGLDNVLAYDPDGTADRYPHVDPARILELAPDVVLLPDEPYAFSASDGPEAFPGLATGLVEGRALTWYGPSLVTAREAVLTAVGGIR